MTAPTSNTLGSYLDVAKVEPLKEKKGNKKASEVAEAALNPENPQTENSSMAVSPLSSASGLYLPAESQRAVMNHLNRIKDIASAIQNTEIPGLVQASKDIIVGQKITTLTTPVNPPEEATGFEDKLPGALKELARANNMPGIIEYFSKISNGSRVDCIIHLVRFFNAKGWLGSYVEESDSSGKREVATLPALLSQIDHKKTTREEIERVELKVFEALDQLAKIRSFPEKALPGLDGMLLHMIDSVKKIWKPMLVVLKEEGGEAKIRSMLDHNIVLYKLALEMASSMVKLAHNLKQEIEDSKASPLCAALKRDFAVVCHSPSEVVESKMSNESARVNKLQIRFDNLLRDLKRVEEHLKGVEAHLTISIVTLSRKEELVQNTLWEHPKTEELYWSGKFKEVKKCLESIAKTEDFVPYKDFTPSPQEVLEMINILCVAVKKRRVEFENYLKNNKPDEAAKRRVKEQLRSNFELYNVLVDQSEKIKRELKQKYNRSLNQKVSPLTHEAIETFSKQMKLSREVIEQTALSYAEKYNKRESGYSEKVKALRDLEQKLEDTQHELALAMQTLKDEKAVGMKGTLFGGEQSRIAKWVEEFKKRRSDNERLLSTDEEHFSIRTYEPYKEEKIVEEGPKPS